MENVIYRVSNNAVFRRYQNSYLSYFLMYNFYYLSWALFSALISVYLMDQGFLASQVSLVVSSSYLTSLVTQPLIGKWNDRYDIRKTNAILFLIAAAGGILFMLSHSLWSITISYSLVLMMLNGVNPVMEKLATASPLSVRKDPNLGNDRLCARIAARRLTLRSDFTIFDLYRLYFHHAALCHRSSRHQTESANQSKGRNGRKNEDH